MEAGLEHLSWAGGTLRHVDVLLVVTLPGRVAHITAARTIRLARDLGIPEIVLVGNRVAGQADEQRLRALAAAHDVAVLAMLPDDPAFATADREGTCVLDAGVATEGVRALERLADRLVG